MTEEQVEELLRGVFAISQGDKYGPGGLEYLAMVLGTENNSVAAAIRDGLGEIANAIREVGGHE